MIASPAAQSVPRAVAAGSHHLNDNREAVSVETASRPNFANS